MEEPIKKIIKFVSLELPENYLCRNWAHYLFNLYDTNGRTKKNILNNFQMQIEEWRNSIILVISVSGTQKRSLNGKINKKRIESLQFRESKIRN